MDIVSTSWFAKILAYRGSNVRLEGPGFEQRINLIVETPFSFFLQWLELC